jgi:hypothetical protein
MALLRRYPRAKAQKAIQKNPRLYSAASAHLSKNIFKINEVWSSTA